MVNGTYKTYYLHISRGNWVMWMLYIQNCVCVCNMAFTHYYYSYVSPYFAKSYCNELQVMSGADIETTNNSVF